MIYAKSCTQVFESQVYPGDDTWSNNWGKPDRGNTIIGQDVSWLSIMYVHKHTYCDRLMSQKKLL